MTQEQTDLFLVKEQERYRAINDLINESSAVAVYYPLLILSSVIIAAGLLLSNSAILIGGMLVTPLLTPILLISLGITTSQKKLLQHTAILIAKSVGIILTISIILGIIFKLPESSSTYGGSVFENSLRAALLYFLVAFSSGIAATFAWVHKKVNSILPGISIAVSVVPPLSMVGIAISVAQFETMQYFLMIFLLNLFGIIMGGIIVFSMLKFYQAEATVSSKIEEVIKEENIQKNNQNNKNVPS